ncbi:MAG TPA: chorismate mutase, partial [Coriobacteriia bacterium]|nr:chorismate mutase [Coriobacteriia bacterium]
MSYVPNHKPDTITMLAGPCSIESAEQLEEVGAALEELGLSWIRGGAFKPRTSPYSF